MAEDDIEIIRQNIATAFENDDTSLLAEILEPLDIADSAALFDSLPSAQRDFIWPHLTTEELGQILLETGDEVREGRLKQLDTKEITQIVNGIPDVDDQADIILSLSTDKLVHVLHAMDAQKRQLLESVLSYDEDTAGGLMDLDQITIRADVSLDVVLRYLRIRGEMPSHTDQLFVTDRRDHFLGALYLQDLLTNDPESEVRSIMRTDSEVFNAFTEASEVAREFEDHDLVSAPVVDDEHKLVGRITIDDVVDVIRDEGDHSMMSMAGLSEDEDIFSPIMRSSWRRGIWLGINLMTAFLAAWVIGFFEDILEQVVALAILITIVPSMGGIAGSQTLTLAIRGLALGQLGASNYRSLINKEVLVGLLNGLLWAVVVASFSIIWFENFQIGAVIAFALVVNLLAGALAGALIPAILKQLGIDPAIAGGVILTTVTDVVGIIAFLGMATLVMGS